MPYSSIFFFFNDPATTEIYTLSLHDALPISFTAGKDSSRAAGHRPSSPFFRALLRGDFSGHLHHRYASEDRRGFVRSEEHTSELQSPCNLVCRLLLEKKKNKALHDTTTIPSH